MKRTSVKREKELNQRLRLVRTTIRELTPGQLEQVAAGTETAWVPTCLPFYTRIEVLEA